MSLERFHIETILKNHLKSDDFHIISYRSSDIKDWSIGFLSTQDKVSIRFRSKGRDGILYIFVKTPPESPYHKKNIKSMGIFHREAVLYKEILSTFQQRLKDNTIAECYLSTDDIIVLQDLSKQGFKNRGILDTLDVDHCEKALEALAKFHSLSFLTEKNEGRRLCELIPIIDTEVVATKDNHVGRRRISVSIKALKALIEKFFSHYPPEAKKKAFGHFDNLSEYMKSSESYPNVLVHSDTWINNIMFRYDEKGTVTDASLIDFQLATYMPLSYDVLITLHTTMETGTRDSHYDHLIKHYYSTLSRYLSTWGMDVEDVLTWNVYKNMLEDMLPVALVQAPIFLHFILVPEAIVEPVMASDEEFKIYYEVNRTPYIMAAMEVPEYRNRILELLTNLLNYCSSD